MVVTLVLLVCVWTERERERERERESHYDAIQGLTIKLGADNFHLHFCVCQARQTSYIWNI